MQIVIPMAGLGQRFRDAGYLLPKPLIPVGGVPMIVRVVRDLPPAKRIVFVVHPEHVREHRIDALLRSEFPQAVVVVAPGLTAGQACSVRLALDELDDGDVCVAACDNTHIYHRGKLQQLICDQTLEGLIWTYRGEPRVLKNPHWYGWVAADERGLVERVSVKQPISERMLNDHVVSGTFWFRSARRLAQAIDALVDSNQRVNGEFYLDAVPNVLMRQGHQVGVFEVESYIGWGTPADLEAYERMAA
jgi:NDP-sugar pyrophosphorylase family protein